MASAVPKTPFEVRRETNRVLGFRMVQVQRMIHDRLSSSGESPSYAEIRDALDFLTNSDVRKVVVRLEQRGLLSRSGRQSGDPRRGGPRMIRV
jgi:SOS-response transcriptional repressor LexA